MLYEILSLAVGLGLGLGAGYRAKFASVKNGFEKRIAALQSEMANKLVAIHSELSAVEDSADRRIVPVIHAVTKRIKGLL